MHGMRATGSAVYMHDTEINEQFRYFVTLEQDWNAHFSFLFVMNRIGTAHQALYMY